MINRIWTILNRGITPTSPYSRKLTPNLYTAEWPNQQALDILVPFSMPVLERHFRIEQLVQGVLKSSVAERARAFDVLNTYEKAEITYPEAGFFDDSIYEGFYIGDEGESFSIYCELDPAALTFTVDGIVQSFTITNNLTSALQLSADAQVRFRGPFSGLDRFTISYTPFLKVPWQSLLQQLDIVDMVWSDKDLRTVWLEDYFWLNRISAVVLMVAEGGEN